MDPRGAAASHYRGGRLVVCCHGSDAVQTTNQKIEDIFRRVQIGNRPAVSPLGREYSTATVDAIGQSSLGQSTWGHSV